MSEKKLSIKPSTLAVILIVLAVVGIIVWQVYYVTPPTVAYKYTTGLTVKFKIYNAGTYSLVTVTEAPLIELYTAGANPFTRTFTTKPLATASYDATNGYWTVPLDAGTYTLLIRDPAAPTFYPEKYTVTVSGTNSEDREVWLTPSQLNVYDRATITLGTPAILAYDPATGAYDTDVPTIDLSDYDKWLVTYTITISDADSSKIVKAGRFYMTRITGLIPTQASLDGAIATLNEDTDGSDDGMTGYCLDFNEMTVGEVHRIDVYFEDVGASTGTLTGTLFEYYACLRSGTTLRWWTIKTAPLTVEA